MRPTYHYSKILVISCAALLLLISLTAVGIILTRNRSADSEVYLKQNQDMILQLKRPLPFGYKLEFQENSENLSDRPWQYYTIWQENTEILQIELQTGTCVPDSYTVNSDNPEPEERFSISEMEINMNFDKIGSLVNYPVYLVKTGSELQELYQERGILEVSPHNWQLNSTDARACYFAIKIYQRVPELEKILQSFEWAK